MYDMCVCDAKQERQVRSYLDGQTIDKVVVDSYLTPHTTPLYPTKPQLWQSL